MTQYEYLYPPEIAKNSATLPGAQMIVTLWQALKAFEAMLVTLAGISICKRFPQLAKARFPIEVIPEGIFTAVNAHPSNVSSSIAVKLPGRTKSGVIFMYESNGIVPN